MLPLVAQEAARPHYLCDSFYELTAPGDPPDSVSEPNKAILRSLRLPSLILFQPALFVLLHFEVNADNQFTSPQNFVPLADKDHVAVLPVEFFRNPIKIQRSDPSSQMATGNPDNRLDVQRLHGKDRVNKEFDQRRGATEDFTQQSVASNRYGIGQGMEFGNGTQIAQSNAARSVLADSIETDSTTPARIGATQPVWIGERLVFSRRVDWNLIIRRK